MDGALSEIIYTFSVVCKQQYAYTNDMCIYTHNFPFLNQCGKVQV